MHPGVVLLVDVGPTSCSSFTVALQQSNISQLPIPGNAHTELNWPAQFWWPVRNYLTNMIALNIEKKYKNFCHFLYNFAAHCSDMFSDHQILKNESEDSKLLSLAKKFNRFFFNGENNSNLILRRKINIRVDSDRNPSNFILSKL